MVRLRDADLQHPAVLKEWATRSIAGCHGHLREGLRDRYDHTLFGGNNDYDAHVVSTGFRLSF